MNKKKKCAHPKCEELRPVFYSRPKSADGLTDYCRNCIYKANAKWRAANREKYNLRVAKAMRAYRLRHPERVREQQRKWRAANLEKKRLQQRNYHARKRAKLHGQD